MADDAALLTTAHAGPKRFTWDDVIAMSRAGLFGETERVELEGGELYVIPEEGPLHVDALEAIRRWLDAHLPATLTVSIRGPLHLPDGAVYIPDLCVFPAGFRARDMIAANARLVIEISDTTLNRDKRRKVPRYAAAGIAEFWLVDPVSRTVTVHRQPATDWGSVEAFGVDASIAPLCMAKAAFVVADLPTPDL